jgi:hypothetical protein
MLPVRVIGGPGKEVPPERARTNHKKKEWSALRRNCLKKTRGTCLGATWNASVPAPVEQCQAAVRGGRMKRRKFY